MGEIEVLIARLKHSYNPSLGEVLIARLKYSYNPSVGQMAAEALGKIGKPAVPALIKTLGDEDPAVGGNAARALSNIGMPAIPALIEVLASESRNARRDAAEALGEFVSKTDTVEDVEKVEAMLKEASDVLSKKLRDRNIEAMMGLAKVMKKVSEKKNELASKRDVLLDAKPKPPERGKMFQAARRARSG